MMMMRTYMLHVKMNYPSWFLLLFSFPNLIFFCGGKYFCEEKHENSQGGSRVKNFEILRVRNT